MVATDEEIRERVVSAGLSDDGEPAVLRERLASWVEDRFQDYLEAWEIRSGRPWREMTREEAETISATDIKAAAALRGNPGFLSILLRRGL